MVPDAIARDTPDGAKFLFGPDFPEGNMDDVLPQIKLEYSLGAIVNNPGADNKEGEENEAEDSTTAAATEHSAGTVNDDTGAVNDDTGAVNDPSALNEEEMDTEATTAAATEHSPGAVNEEGKENEAEYDVTLAAATEHEEDNEHKDDETETERYNSAASDRIVGENAIRYLRLVGRPGTGQRRTPLFSDLWQDIERMEWNGGHD